MTAEIKAGWLYKGRAVGEFGRGHFVPVLGDGDNVYLIDSAVLRSGSMQEGESKTDAAIRRCIELTEKNCQFTVGATRFDYYRGDMYVNGPYKWGDTVEGFDEVCDLHDMRGLKPSEDERWFDVKDKVEHVRLYREHGYSWTYGDIGVTLIEKNAEPLLGKKFDAAHMDWRPVGPSPERWKFREVEKCAIDMSDAGVPMTPEQKVKLKVGREQVKLLEEWQEKYEELCGGWNRRTRLARYAQSGDAFKWSGTVDGAPEWVVELVEDGTFGLEPHDDDRFNLLWPHSLLSEMDEDWDGADRPDLWNSCSPGMWLFRNEEKADDEWVVRYGSFDAEWEVL